MRRVALLMLPFFAVGLVVIAVVALRRRSERIGESIVHEPEREPTRMTDPPEVFGHSVEALDEHGMSLHDELREEEQEHRHGALQHLSNELLAPKQV